MTYKTNIYEIARKTNIPVLDDDRAIYQHLEILNVYVFGLKLQGPKTQNIY